MSNVHYISKTWSHDTWDLQIIIFPRWLSQWDFIIESLTMKQTFNVISWRNHCIKCSLHTYTRRCSSFFLLLSSARLVAALKAKFLANFFLSERMNSREVFFCIDIEIIFQDVSIYFFKNAFQPSINMNIWLFTHPINMFLIPN